MSIHPIDRRGFVRAMALTGGSLIAGSALACDQDVASPHVHAPPEVADLAKGGGGAVTRVPLRVPPVVTPSALTLEAKPGAASIVPGKTTPVLLYNNEFPGPTLQASSGSTVSATFVNSLSEPSITHWHGMLVDHQNDGHPMQAVAPGASYGYSYTIDQRAALNWYHPHPHKLTGGQVYRGLAGAFIVRDSVDTGLPGNPLGLPVGAYEVPLIIRDASFDSSGGLQFSNKSSGYWGNKPLVNGTLNPQLGVDQGIYRLRILNGCNARVLRLALTGGATFRLIGNDGGLLDQSYTLTELTASPGERFDVLVDFRTLAAGATVMLRCLDARWDILEFRGSGATGGASAFPNGALSSIAPLGAPTSTRRFTFDGMTRINGKAYDMDDPGFEVTRGVVERWRFVTNGNGPHPVHVHGAHFQVESRTGGRGMRYDWERGWKDTVLVNDGETVDVLIRFSAHSGMYVLHCHQLAHEDSGMMMNFRVVEP